MKNFLLGFIAGALILSILVYFLFCKGAVAEKKEVLEFEIADTSIAKRHVKNFFRAYPDSVMDTLTRKKYPVGVFFTIYAVKFKLNPTKNEMGYRGSEIEAHYPNVDFKSILEKAPENADGIRIYEAIDMDEKAKKAHLDDMFSGLNYITFTKESTRENHCPSNDILSTVYRVINHNFDLREFRQPRVPAEDCKKSPLSSHLSCAPHCPDESLLK